MSQIIIMAAILIYLAAMLGVGFYCSKQNNSVDDFYLGGRKLGPFVTAMSAEASDMSSWLLMGLPCCLSFRCCKCSMDSHWACNRYICQLADCSQKNPCVFQSL